MMEYYDEVFLNNCIIAEGRRKRPMIDAKSLECPFCFPHEGVVIWENKYPVASQMTMPYGQHDVVIDTPLHNESPKDFSLARWEEILFKIQRRWLELGQDEKIQFIQVFKNFGRCGGASISHSHWQILALSEVPQSVQHQYKQYNVKETCYLCETCKSPMDYKILETQHFIVCSPKAPRFAYETLLIPKAHYQHYGELPEHILKEAALLLQKVIKAYDLLESDCAYNICMMGSALNQQLDYHFHIKVAMRLGNMAGFEVATGCFINMVSPMKATAEMKKLLKE